MLTGTIKWFDKKKGFGFVGRDDGEKDVFVHATDLRASSAGEPDEGDRMQFEIKDTPRGLKAINLKPSALPEATHCERESPVADA